MIAPTGSEYSYLINVDGDIVQSTPQESEDVLEGMHEALKEDSLTKLKKTHAKIKREQVRKEVVNALRYIFDEPHRIEPQANGWIIDGLFWIDWSGNLYTRDDDPDENDKIRSGNEVVEADTSFEFVTFRQGKTPEPKEVTINNETIMLTEREMLFITKARWICNRRHYHPDQPFWDYVERFTDRPAKDSNEVADELF
jgi:hypothetical protein